MKTGQAGEHIHVVEHVTQYQGAIRDTPVSDVPRTVARGFKDHEAGNLISFMELSRDGMGRTGEDLVAQASYCAFRHPVEDQAGIFYGIGVGLTTPERNAQLLANLVAGPLVIGMGMRQDVGANRVTAKLAQDPSTIKSRGGINEHIAHQVDVEGIGRKPTQVV
jgi:hypothetical protein